MKPTRYNLPIVQGSDVDFTVQIYADDGHTTLQNITGWTAKMQIRDKPGGTILADSSTSDITLTINGPAGEVLAHIAASKTSAFTWVEGAYDLFVFGPSNTPTDCVLFGDVTVQPQVTV